jgi:hypothetical protein
MSSIAPLSGEKPTSTVPVPKTQFGGVASLAKLLLDRKSSNYN